MKIKTEDKIEIPFTAEKVFEALDDTASYKKWWPKFVTFSVKNEPEDGRGAVVRVNPFWGPGFNWAVREREVNRRIVLEYFGGIYSGAGVWNIESTPRGSIVKYTVDIQSGSILINAVSKFISIEKIHSYTMKKVFIELENFLK